MSKRTLADFLAVGRVVAAHGVRGEIKVDVLTDFMERYEVGSELYLEGEESPRRVLSSRPHKDFLLVLLPGLEDRSLVESLRGRHLLVPRDQAMPLAEDEYYADVLHGLRVFTHSGRDLGILTDVFWTGANEVYRVEGAFGEIWLPAIADVVLQLDLQNGNILVNLLPGLVPELDNEVNQE